MIYTPDNTYKQGKPVKKIIDANGFDMGQYLLECDTDTGRVLRWQEDKEGNPVIVDYNFVREEVYGAPPLLVIFFKDQ